MSALKVLKQKLNAIDLQDYGAYQSLPGEYEYPGFKLIIEQIPKDPYAPSHTGIYRIQVNAGSWLNQFSSKTNISNIAIRDYLARSFYSACQKNCGGIRGTGNSGLITIERPGQCILERSSVILVDQIIEVRCFLGMPAVGRIISSRIAQSMFFDELAVIVEKTLFENSIDKKNLQNHILTSENAEFLRKNLKPKKLVAFIADNSILPRESSSSGLPFSGHETIPFISPQNMRVSFDLPGGEKIRGLAIPEGVTLIAGGGYHGKSTLLKTIEEGIYNHIPGDGRERCVSVRNSVKVRAYNGRYIEKTDISPFINNLPFGKDTCAFCTDNASGSTSQAASIAEAIEVGAEVLLMDEDTCATNFMLRDEKMQKLVAKQDEPITTFIDKARQIYSDLNISTILVLGGMGDYFEVSDHVIQMIRYRPYDVTKKARQIVKSSKSKRTTESRIIPCFVNERIPIAESISPLNDHGKRSVFAKEKWRLHFGKGDIDLTDLEQIVELSQTKALGFAMEYVKRYMDGILSLKEIIDQFDNDIEEYGVEKLSAKITGNLAGIRGMEIAFALNRLKGFRVMPLSDY